MRLKIDYGIDLGTTNSAIARMEKGAPKIIKSDVLKDTVPSCVHYNRKQYVLVGDPAMNVMKTDSQRAMKNFRKGETNTFIEFKRTMGTTVIFPSKNMNKELTSEELSAEILKKLKSFVLDENISSIVITVPAKFISPQNEATIKAAKLAGFKQVRLLQEPIAAATAYGLNAEQKDGYWLVFDFGGGTFDAALIKVEDGAMTVKDTDGDNWLGGKNLDEAIVDQIIIPNLQRDYHINSILNDPDKREILRNGIKRFAEEAKNQMSFKDAYNILSDLGDFPFEDEFGEEPEINITVTQKDMERVLAPIFQKAIDITRELLKRNNMNGSDLDELILVGGPTHSPILRRMLKEQITEKVNTSVDPMTVVAQGAAIYASNVDVVSIGDIDDDIKDHTIRSGQKNDDIIKDPSDPKIQLSLQYNSSTTETSEYVSLQVSREKSTGKLPDKIFAEIKRSDGAFSSGLKQINDEKRSIVEVEILEEPRVNGFEIFLTDGEGNLLECTPNEFTVMYGDIPSPVLAYHVGIAKYFEDREEDLFFPVKGLEKNKTIPEGKLTGVINGLQTRSEIRSGNANDHLRIPIYQGDYNAAGSDLALNHLICEVIITGKTIPGHLPVGSIVDITIKIDQSLTMFFNAYFPALDYSEELEIEIQQIRIQSVQSLKKDIDKAKEKAEKAGAKEIIEELSELEKQVEHDKGSPDGMMKNQDHLRKIILKLPQVKANWPEVANEMNKACSELKNFVRQLEMSGDGDKLDMGKITAHLDDIDRKIRQITAEKNIREAKEVIREIEVLDFQIRDAINGGMEWVKMLAYLSANVDTLEWKDPVIARQLIAKGMELALAGHFNEIRVIIAQLYQLLPKDTPTGGTLKGGA
ncbi:MAG: Hsp70 family protein [Bacteroidales bacterium]|jgi:molecular chaperone DnaK|nr:Hsp70 family protein [Bacteroidales bacterium]